MSYTKQTAAYGNARYAQAVRAWDDHFSATRAHALYWRLGALAALGIALVAAVGLSYAARNPVVRTFVVEIDSAGLPARITHVDGAYRPKDSQIAYFIAQLVRQVRGRSLDPVVLRGNWVQAYRYLAGDAVSTMTVYARRDDELARAAGKPLARTVEISSVLARSSETFQVRWTETTYVAGVPHPPRSFTGLFTIELKPPRTEEDVFHNPLGIYVTNFSWSREFDAGIAADRPPSEDSNAKQ